MLKIGITGGIGSGKSLICRVFSILGAPVYNADIQAKKLMNQDPELMTKLIQSFGTGVYREGKLDRKALAGIVFNDQAALNLLNSIVHPAVRSDFNSWIDNNNKASYVIKEAAILFETGMHTGLDTVILITAPEDLRLQRIMRREGEDKESVRKRMASQWTDEKKAALAGMVIRNDNTQSILPVILKMHYQFSRGNLTGLFE